MLLVMQKGTITEGLLSFAQFICRELVAIATAAFFAENYTDGGMHAILHEGNQRNDKASVDVSSISITHWLGYQANPIH